MMCLDYFQPWHKLNFETFFFCFILIVGVCGIPFLSAHPAQARELFGGLLFGGNNMVIVTRPHLVKLLRNFTAHSLVILFGNTCLVSQLGDASNVSVFNGVEQHDRNRCICTLYVKLLENFVIFFHKRYPVSSPSPKSPHTLSHPLTAPSPGCVVPFLFACHRRPGSSIQCPYFRCLLL